MATSELGLRYDPRHQVFTRARSTLARILHQETTMWNTHGGHLLSAAFSFLVDSAGCNKNETKKTLYTRGFSNRVTLNMRVGLTRTPHGTLKILQLIFVLRSRWTLVLGCATVNENIHMRPFWQVYAQLDPLPFWHPHLFSVFSVVWTSLVSCMRRRYFERIKEKKQHIGCTPWLYDKMRAKVQCVELEMFYT